MNDADLNLATLSEIFADEDRARAFLESKRWPDGKPVCPHCEHEGAYRLTAKLGSKRPVRKGVWKCKKCRRQFTVRIGTIFEDSKIPLRKWLMAIHLMTSSKKGVSSHQISRECGITIKSAWFLTHRIREAMTLEPMAGLLEGAVEVDETYVGGKPRIKGQSKRGRGTKKTAVVALVERHGKQRVRSRPVERVDSRTLHSEIRGHVDKKAIILTDDHGGYIGIGKHFLGGHESVNHSGKEYVRVAESGLPVHTNTAESYFALFKRGHYGIFHHFSKRHLHRYCNEFSFRWDHRKVTDGQRMVAAIRGAEGKRLYYKQPIKSDVITGERK